MEKNQFIQIFSILGLFRRSMLFIFYGQNQSTVHHDPDLCFGRSGSDHFDVNRRFQKISVYIRVTRVHGFSIHLLGHRLHLGNRRRRVEILRHHDHNGVLPHHSSGLYFDPILFRRLKLAKSNFDFRGGSLYRIFVPFFLHRGIAKVSFFRIISFI